MAHWVKDPAFSLLWLGHCYVIGSVSGPGTSTCHKHDQKREGERKEKEKRKKNEKYKLPVIR